ncbi:hypothetical protein [Helicobacter sp.]|uniref:hypothetical protein n=1 Tax=Helicobacter sp. TaxID=218 RepID=UPI0025BC8701|nr:hypothetical protein [Helicobacter sp.]MCI5633715.1 hypothetical protein [Helicobacter sp.]MDY5557571.1 hypothetical protein [Helicobacter sp.]
MTKSKLLCYCLATIYNPVCKSFYDRIFIERFYIMDCAKANEFANTNARYENFSNFLAMIQYQNENL